MITMCAESYDQSDQTDAILMFINNIFIAIFTAECFMKLLALNWRFFKIPWNVFDITIVVLSILGKTIIIGDFLIRLFKFSKYA